jgi:UDP-4-amino-4,6-dideoxy-N-acetyl-beta-L-altrosamine N-acetyltransferase
MTSADLHLVLAWRNHESVRRYMYTQHEIALHEHSQWFERATKDPNRHLLIFETDGVPLGFINIHPVAAGGIADWGFYSAPDAPKGVGRALGRATMQHVFTQIGMHKLCGQALAYNDRSIKFHLSLGFRREGVLLEHHLDGQTYHDVVCFGLLAKQWQAQSLK